MAVINEGIKAGQNGAVSFGNYSVKEKIKAKLEISGDEYAVKTHDELTRLEKNGALVIETDPGAAIHDFLMTDKSVSFKAEGAGDTQFTLGLASGAEYDLIIGGELIGKVTANKFGKAVFSADIAVMKEILLKRR